MAMISILWFICLTGVFANGLHPVILIPGDGGSQLQAKLNKSNSVHYLCQKTTSDYFTLWLNIEEFIKIVIDCWVDNAKLQYDNRTRSTRNQDGVDIRVPGWGDSTTVEWLDPLKLPTGAYFKDIGNALVQLGYERNVSLRGAPYDFRKAPNENQEWFENLKQLVEETYKINNDSRVVLVAHSMGAPMSHRFLIGVSQEWKDKYINFVITLSGAWAGSVKSLKVFYMGDDLGVFILPEGTLREAQITMPSIAWLLPWPMVWKPDQVFIETSSKKISLSNLKQFFLDIDYETGWQMTQDQSSYWNLTPPGVKIYCLTGTGVPTVEKMIFDDGQWPSGKPSFEMGNGDGTVNEISLNVCKHWNGTSNTDVFFKDYAGVDHQNMLHNTEVVSDLLTIITGRKVNWDGSKWWWNLL